MHCSSGLEFYKAEEVQFNINQSIKIYIAPLQDLYSEALPTQAKRKTSQTVPVLRTGTVWEVP